MQVLPEVDLEVIVDGRRERLCAGVRTEQRVAEALVLSLPGVADITVIAGAGVAERRKVLEQAATRLRELCIEAGVDDHAGAVAALAARRAAAAELARSEERLAQALGSDTPASLARRVAELAARLAALASERSSRSASARDARSGGARARAGRARGRARARAAPRSSRGATKMRRCASSAATSTAARRTQRLELAGEARADLERRLAAAREEVSDEELDARREARVERGAGARGASRARPRRGSRSASPSSSRCARRARATRSPPTSARCASSATRCSRSASGSR